MYNARMLQSHVRHLSSTTHSDKPLLVRLPSRASLLSRWQVPERVRARCKLAVLVVLVHELALARKTGSLGELLLVLNRLTSETGVVASADVAVRLHVPQAALAMDLVPKTGRRLMVDDARSVSCVVLEVPELLLLVGVSDGLESAFD